MLFGLLILFFLLFPHFGQFVRKEEAFPLPQVVSNNIGKQTGGDIYIVHPRKAQEG